MNRATRLVPGAFAPIRRSAARSRIAALLFALPVLSLGCHAARVFAPPVPLRGASVATYAIQVEFAESLDRASAEDPSRYEVRLAGAPASVVTSATLVDTLYGRVVQLVIPAWLEVNADTSDVQVTTRGVLTLERRDTGTRTVAFRTGLSYSTPLKELFDSHCTSCHGPTVAEGGYRTDSYDALLGDGSDARPNLVPSDPNCLIVRRCRPRNSMFNLGRLDYLDYEVLKNWVVSYQARP